jgi:hypothetical protein
MPLNKTNKRRRRRFTANQNRRTLRPAPSFPASSKSSSSDEGEPELFPHVRPSIKAVELDLDRLQLHVNISSEIFKEYSPSTGELSKTRLDKIVRILDKPANPTSRISMRRFINNHWEKFSLKCLLNTDFYAALDHDPAMTLDDFLHEVREAPKVRIVAMCHGCISNQFKSLVKVSRIAMSPYGLRSGASWNSNTRADLLEMEYDDEAFKTKARSVARMDIEDVCQSVEHHIPRNEGSEVSDERKLFYQCVNPDRNPTEKPYEVHDRIPNKTFESTPGLNFLFIGYSPDNSDAYVYRNLFARNETFDLRDIMRFYLRNCEELLLADFSCNDPCAREFDYLIHKERVEPERFTRLGPDGKLHPHFRTFGGKKNKKKKFTSYL